MDLDTGNLYCLFFPYSPEHLLRSVPKSKDTSPFISVSVNASLREAHRISGSASASALFVGGFSILEMDKVIKKDFMLIDIGITSSLHLCSQYKQY